MKICKTCRVTKATEQFSLRKLNGKRDNICRSCISQRSRERRHKKYPLTKTYKKPCFSIVKYDILFARWQASFPQTKRCGTCQQSKSHIFFYKRKSTKDGFSHRCKDCYSKYYERRGRALYNQRNLRSSRRELLNIYINRQIGQVFNNLTIIKYMNRNVYGAHIWLCRCRCGQERTTTLSSLRGCSKHRCNCLLKNRTADPFYRIRISVKLRTNYALSKAQVVKRFEDIQIYLGCSWELFYEHLKSLWKPGMTWENYGKYWVIDHIRPVASFILTMEEEVLKCFNYSNTQPLTKKENSQKGSYWEADSLDIVCHPQYLPQSFLSKG